MPNEGALRNPLENISFLSLFDASAEALILSDSDGCIIQTNPAAREMFGYPEEELLGSKIEMLIPKRLRERHLRYRENYLAQPEKRPMGRGRNLLALSRNGRELQVDIGLSPIRDGNNLFILISFFDATQSRAAQLALQESEERLRLAEHAAGLGVFDRDLTSDTLHWDARSLEILGLAPDTQITYEKFLEITHPDDRASRLAALGRSLNPEGEGEYKAEFRIIRPNDGSVRWIASTGKVIFEQGQAVRIVGVMQDVTDQKAIESKLREQRTAMESLLKRQVAAQTASAIAHELNQPLAALSAYSEVALHELANIECPEKLSRALNRCVEQAHRAGKTLHELLEFLHRGDLLPEAMDINETVKEAIAIVQNDGYSGFHPKIELETDMPLVRANRLQVQKVLTNLIRNGVEAMQTGGVPAAEITVRVQTLRQKNMALVTIQDQGPGLDDDMAKRVFDPFFTTKTYGIGMGLAISRGLIEANGGELWADPVTGAGAVFHFTLPFAS
ncbi:MAG: PAS domain S-box protein [Methylophilaceae bacterium]|uniref:PAS domain-containing sensor histidine kinase n=1 Tax=Methylobacillus sp. MM3 TaxID=1848039 RepID=UPI00210FEA01|nr:PAS domain S-box protein [Methylobacillus sp. MM3]